MCRPWIEQYRPTPLVRYRQSATLPTAIASRMSWKLHPKAAEKAQLIIMDEAALVENYIQQLMHYAYQCIKERGEFVLALSGGSQPACLSRASFINDPNMPYELWQVHMVDERCTAGGEVDGEEVDLNQEEIKRHLLNPATGPSRLAKAAFVWCTRASLDTNACLDPAASAADGVSILASECTKHLQHACPSMVLDWVALGLGPDGHTASLFPTSLAIWPVSKAEPPRYIPITNSPKSPPHRVSMNLPLLCQARRLAFLVVGQTKSTAIAHILTDLDPSLPPTQLLLHTTATVDWWVDRLAGDLLIHATQ